MYNIYKVVQLENGIKWDRIVSEKPLTLYKKASQKEIFDFCIKQKILSGSYYLPGMKLDEYDESYFGFYLSRYNKYYDRYLSNKSLIHQHLSSEIYDKYSNSKGNEFKTGKFYSVASSSRFAVSSFTKMTDAGKIELVKELCISGQPQNVQIELEKELQIEGLTHNATPPQMDIVIRTPTDDVYFIEAKCHEILDCNEHKYIKLKWKYFDLPVFQRLPLEHNRLLKLIVKNNDSIDEYISIDSNYLTAKDFGCILETSHFDIKQFICHLLGIISYHKANTNYKIHFYYLFYKNQEYIEYSKNNIYIALEKEIAEIFRVFSPLFPEIDFGFLYNQEFNTITDIRKET